MSKALPTVFAAFCFVVLSHEALAQTQLQGRVERGAGDGILTLIQSKFSIKTNFDAAVPFSLSVQKPQLDLLPFPLGASVFGAAIRLRDTSPEFLIDGQPVAPKLAPVHWSTESASFTKIVTAKRGATIDGDEFPARKHFGKPHPDFWIDDEQVQVGTALNWKDVSARLHADDSAPKLVIDGETIVSVKAKLIPHAPPPIPQLAPPPAAPVLETPILAAPIFASTEHGAVSWDEWYVRFAELVRQPLIDSMLEADSPRGSNTIKITVTDKHRVSVQIHRSANAEFDAAVIRAYEGLQGNDGLQFPAGSHRSSQTFFTEHSHHDEDDCVAIDVKSIKGDNEF